MPEYSLHDPRGAEELEQMENDWSRRHYEEVEMAEKFVCLSIVIGGTFMALTIPTQGK